MNKTFKENPYIMFLVLVVVLGVLFFLFNGTELDEINIVEENGITENLVIDSDNDSNTSAPVVVNSKTLQEKFNIALENGSKASLDKNYGKAISYYKEALGYMEADTAYIRLYSVYNAIGDNTQALLMLNKAIQLNKDYTDYWITKIVFLDEKTDTDYAGLVGVYEEGLINSDPRTKINLVIRFARVAEANGKYTEAASYWQRAIELYPQNSSIYQAEIDLLSNL